jgi:hypothetical protein
MPSGKSAPGTTWRPIEAATTPGVPNLKLSATKLSKNIITLQTILQAISVPTFPDSRFLKPAPSPNLRLPMSFLIGIPTLKHYPSPRRLRSSLYLSGCKLFQIQADVYCVGTPEKLSYAKSGGAG